MLKELSILFMMIVPNILEQTEEVIKLMNNIRQNYMVQWHNLLKNHLDVYWLLTEIFQNKM